MSLPEANALIHYFDSVVMLTWSDWKTEPRSNRYHYALRFSRCLPVVFVQADLPEPETRFEPTELGNVVILHVYSAYGYEQSKLINRALLERGFTRPLLWVYNAFFGHFLEQRYSPLVIYHATEDYFSPDVSTSSLIHQSLRNVLKRIDLLVAVSNEVLLSYKRNGLYSGKILLLENGCDFSFWAPKPGEKQQVLAQNSSRKVAFYQGGINSRLDLELIQEVCRRLPDWEVWLCGIVAAGFTDERINPEGLPNLRNFGFLSPGSVRDLAYRASVGIIPFLQNDMVRVSLPLKAFEYVATGLPVVSVPIPALEAYPDGFAFADNPGDFSRAIVEAAETRQDPAWLERRLELARKQDYDGRFRVLLHEIDAMMNSNKKNNEDQFNVLVLYDAHSLHVSTIKEHLLSFSRYSSSRIFYAPATGGALCTFDLSIFDVIVIHYCVRVSLEDHLSVSYAQAVQGFGGYKVLFIQDEYDTTETARRWIERLGIDAVFTCVPDEYVDEVYPKSRFPYLERVRTLTGFVPIGIERHEPKPISERRIVIGYRGRPLPFYYGDLGREKVTIAQRMKQICQERNIPEDIEWTHEKRIYGDQWYPFVESSKATLGTESGSNVFDDYGEIKKNVEQALARNASSTYEEIHASYIAPYEGKIRMNQISPRVFEAIALRTALVLFEGQYSGVIQPGLHYIPLKKDFSNIEDVLAKLVDDQYLTALTERAYNDIILSNKYSYQQFVKRFDAFLSSKLIKRSDQPPMTTLLEIHGREKKGEQFAAISKYSMVSLSPLAAAEINLLTNTDLSLGIRDIFKLTRLWIRQRFPVAYRRTEKLFIFMRGLLERGTGS